MNIVVPAVVSLILFVDVEWQAKPVSRLHYLLSTRSTLV